MNNKLVLQVLLILALASPCASTPEVNRVALPMVSAAEMPLYPRGARLANIEGVVQVSVTTDGHGVIAAVIEKGSIPLLARSAEQNVRTWRFEIHEPTTFTITYRYRLVSDIDPIQNNPRVTLRLPTEILVEDIRPPGY